MKHERILGATTALATPAFEVKDGGTPTDIAGAVTQIKTLFEEFKTANDARLKEIESKGSADTLIEEKTNAINAEITKLTGIVTELQKKAGRPQFTGDGEKAAAELKAFNLALKSNAVTCNRPAPADITPEQYAEYKSNFVRTLRRDSRDLTDEERKTLAVGSDPDGGFLVPETMETAIDRVVTQLGAMRGAATVITIGTAGYKKPVVTSGATSGWAGETTTPSETETPKISELSFVPGTLWAEPHATTQLLEDANVDIEGWLAGEIAMEFAEAEGDAFVNGSGVNRPRGFLAYDIVANASYEWGKIGYVPSGAAGAFASSNPSDALITLQHALKRQHRPGAAFMMNDATLASIRKFKDGSGIYMWQPDLTQGVLGVLLGSPVLTDDFMPDVAADSFSVAFGNWKRGYVIVERRGTSILRDPYTRKPYVKFYATKRVGGGVQNFEAIKLMKFATS
jgi:HK97 family phage major capsid protein